MYITRLYGYSCSAIRTAGHRKQQQHPQQLAEPTQLLLILAVQHKPQLLLRLLLLYFTVAVAMPITAAVIPHLVKQYIDYVRGVHVVRQYGTCVG